MGFDPTVRQYHVVAIPSPAATVRSMVVDWERRRFWFLMADVQRIGRIDLPG